MNLLANENFPFSSVVILRELGYDVVYIGEISPGLTDAEVMNLAVKSNRTIITFDRDYGELVFKQGYQPQAGIIYLRLFVYTPEEPAEILHRIFNQPISFENFFTVIDPFHIRQRKIY